jgi:predicted unusual protein kinase regulating ubiquinone biosynthesis (AarF/ABC1/UbiB family)
VSGDRRPRFIWYDGGSIVQSNPRWREDLLQLSLSVIRSDVPSIVRNLEEMGIVQKGVVRYRRAVTRLIRMVLEEQKAMMSNENVMAAIVESIDRDAVWKADLRESFASESPYVILGKSILVLSQICIKLDPTFNLVQAAMPIVRKYWGAGGASDAGGFDQLWNELSVMVEGFSTMPTRVQSLQQQVYEMNDQLNAGDVSSRTGAAASPTRARIESAVIASVVVTLIQHLLL